MLTLGVKPSLWTLAFRQARHLLRVRKRVCTHRVQLISPPKNPKVQAGQRVGSLPTTCKDVQITATDRPSLRVRRIHVNNYFKVLAISTRFRLDRSCRVENHCTLCRLGENHDWRMQWMENKTVTTIMSLCIINKWGGEKTFLILSIP